MTILVFLLFIFTVESSRRLNPVLLVPGDMGSQMKAYYTGPPPHMICGERNRWFYLWLDFKYFLPYHKLFDCLSSSMRLNYDRHTRRTSTPDFIRTVIPGFGTVDTIESLTQYLIPRTSYFFNIIHDLETKFGYTANRNIRGAPYDFRRGPNELEGYLSNVKVLIERMWMEGGGERVIVIAHSLGNLHMVRLFNTVSQPWKDKYIKTFISISAPFAGLMKSVYAIFTGYHTVPYIPPQNFQSLSITWPSNYYLFPSPVTWSTEVIVATRYGNYTAQNIKKLLRRSNVKDAVDHYEDVYQYIVDLAAPNVTMHCVYSMDVPTMKLLDYRGRNIPLSDPIITYGDGDGTVNLESLRLCHDWKKQQSHEIIEHVVRNVSHFNMAKSVETLSIINDIISVAP